MSSLPDYTRDRVWVYDHTAGLAYPTHKDNPDLKLDPDRYTVDAKHPVTDDRGRLLAAKTIEPKTPPAKTKPAETVGKEK